MTENQKKSHKFDEKKRNRKRRSFDNKTKNKSNQKKTRRSRWNANRISEHFLKRDFDSRRKDCDCSSSLRISLGLVGVIEAIRAKLNKRIEIVNGYYCPDCRERQYGVKRDFHQTGVAADIRVNDLDVIDLFLHVESYEEIKGIGINFDDNHVHIDTRKEDERETWVEKDGEWILLTDENRNDFIPSKITDEQEPSESN